VFCVLVEDRAQEVCHIEIADSIVMGLVPEMNVPEGVVSEVGKVEDKVSVETAL
jgi:hypothetical protein